MSIDAGLKSTTISTAINIHQLLHGHDRLVFLQLQPPNYFKEHIYFLSTRRLYNNVYLRQKQSANIYQYILSVCSMSAVDLTKVNFQKLFFRF